MSKPNQYGEMIVPVICRILVTPRQRNGRTHLHAAHQSGITGLSACHAGRLYFLQGRLTDDDVQQIAAKLLADPVTEQWTVSNNQLDSGEKLSEPL